VTGRYLAKIFDCQTHKKNSLRFFPVRLFSSLASWRLGDLGESNFFCLNVTSDAPPPHTPLETALCIFGRAEKKGQLPTKITAKKGDKNVSRKIAKTAKKNQRPNSEFSTLKSKF
jgi:hypothetical protein